MPTFGQLSEFVAESECMSSYLERVELYFLANNVQDDMKAAVFFSSIRAKTYEVLRSLVSPDQPNTKTLDELKTLLRAHFELKPLVISERLHFYRHNQLAGESMTDFLVEFRRLAAQCEFKNSLDEALRGQVVGGLKSESIQRRLLSERNLDLAKAVEIATAIELADKQSQSFQVPPAQAQVEVKRVSAASPVCKERPKNEDRFKEVIYML